jgi:[protein-PII] uridylyltransferase
MMLDTQRSVRAADELIDPAAIAADLSKLAREYAGRERELRTAVAQRLKAALTAARAHAEQLLLKDRHGRRCAERLCQMHDDIIRILFEFAAKELYPTRAPSESEQMAVVATGGYGRGLLAPGSDIDLLFLLPYKQTAWSESVAEALLYCLWDMGLKVGHATRSVNECIHQAKADMTIRTALLEARFLFGDVKLYDELTARFDNEVVRAPRRNSSRQSSPNARSATAAPASRAISSSPTSRTARAGCATCTHCSGSPNTSTACASRRN